MNQFPCPHCGQMTSAPGFSPGSYTICAMCGRDVQVPTGPMSSPTMGGFRTGEVRISSPPPPSALNKPALPSMGSTSYNQPQSYGTAPAGPSYQPSPQPVPQPSPQPAPRPQPASTLQPTPAPSTPASQPEPTQQPAAPTMPSSASPFINTGTSSATQASAMAAVRQDESNKLWILLLLGLAVVLVMGTIALIVFRAGNRNAGNALSETNTGTSSGSSPATPASPPTPTRQPQLSSWASRIQGADDPATRRQMVDSLIAQGPSAVIGTMISTTEFTTSSDGQTVLSYSKPLALALADRGDAQVVRILAQALQHPQPEARVAAAIVAEQLGSRARDLVSPLATVSRDQNQWVRWSALDALAAMGPDAALVAGQVTMLLTHGDEHTRRRAITVLGAIGPQARSALPELERVRDTDPKPTPRTAAIRAINRIRGG